MAEDKRYEAAQKRIAEIRDFYSFLAVYIIAVITLPLINLFVANDKPWSIFFVGGLTFFLFMYASITFGVFGLLGKNWEARKMAQLMGEKPKHIDAVDLFEESLLE
jgi:hypothetical protein